MSNRSSFRLCHFFYTLEVWLTSKYCNSFSLQPQVLDIISKGGVKGIAHITGGGFTDNIPRVFPDGLGAVIYKNSWEIPTVFNWIQEVNMNFFLLILRKFKFSLP